MSVPIESHICPSEDGLHDWAYDWVRCMASSEKTTSCEYKNGCVSA